MNLREARVGEQGAAFVGPPRSGDIRAGRVGRKVIGVRVAAGGEHDGVRHPAARLAGDEIAGHDAAGAPVDDHQVEHLGAGMHVDSAGLNLALEGAIAA